MTREDLIKAIANVVLTNSGFGLSRGIALAVLDTLEAARPDLAAVLRGEAVVVPREASGKMWAAGRSALSSPAEMIRGADYEAASAHADRIPEKVWAAMIAAGEKEMGR